MLLVSGACVYAHCSVVDECNKSAACVLYTSTSASCTLNSCGQPSTLREKHAEYTMALDKTAPSRTLPPTTTQCPHTMCCNNCIRTWYPPLILMLRCSRGRHADLTLCKKGVQYLQAQTTQAYPRPCHNTFIMSQAILLMYCSAKEHRQVSARHRTAPQKGTFEKTIGFLTAALTCSVPGI